MQGLQGGFIITSGVEDIFNGQDIRVVGPQGPLLDIQGSFQEGPSHLLLTLEAIKGQGQGQGLWLKDTHWEREG